MKKILFFASALAALFLAASCQRESLEPEVSCNVVSYTIQVPGAIGTKAIGTDVAAVTELIYEVYRIDEQGTETKLYQKSQTRDAANGETNWTVDLELVNNQDFRVLFWAQVPGNDVYTTTSLKNVTLATDLNANAENYAAFAGQDEITSGENLTGRTVTLVRPVAQLNIATTAESLKLGEDENGANAQTTVSFKTTAVTVEGLSAVYNVADQSVSATTTTFVYGATLPYDNDDATTDNLSEATIKVNNVDHQYVSMNYVGFAQPSGNNVKVTYTIETNEVGTITNTISNVPVKANYRTNIIGNLITSMSDYTVTLDAEWEDEEEIIEIWNGSEVNKPKQSAEDPNIYEIEYPSELAWLAAAVNGTLPETKAAPTPDTFAGKTFKLINNIDLDNHEWTPIGNKTNVFQGTFDGNDKTVKNLLITGNNNYVGLFGFTTNGEIKNLTVENAKVSGRNSVGVVVGSPYTSKFTNITVKGHVEVNGKFYVGGVGGRNAYADWTNVKVEADETSYVNANSVEDGIAYRTYVGGVVGFNGEGGHSFKNITSNIDVKGSTIDVGGLFGIAHYQNVFENLKCTGDVVIYAAEESAEAEEIGGIAGVWMDSEIGPVTFTNIEFTGAVTTNIERETIWYDNLFGKPYNNNGKGKLIVNNAIMVASAAELQAAVAAATDNTAIKFGADIEGNVTVVQKPGVKITIDGAEKNYDGVIKVHGNSNYYEDAALTIKNVAFKSATTYINSDGDPYFNFIEALENGSERYSSNITVEECSFTHETANIAVGLQIKATRNAKVLGCTATKMHSLIQAQSCGENVEVKGCTITDGKNGVAFKQVKTALVEGTTIEAAEYGIRFDGNTDNYGITLKDNTVEARQPFIVRKMTGKNNTIALEGTNTLTPATSGDYQIVITNGSDDAEYVMPTGTYTLTGAGSFNVYPKLPVAKVGSTEYFSIDDAIANWTHNTTLTLVADVTLSDVITLKSTEYHVLDLGTYTMTAATKKDAIQISNEGRSSASWTLDIKADATNPGGITATGKAVVKTTGKSGVKDRPIIRFYNGVFNASNIIQHSGSNGTNCPQFHFYNGVYNGTISANRALIQFYGGTFNGSLFMSVDSSAYALIAGGRFKQLSNLYMSSLNSSKFTIGSAKGVFDKGVYVDDEGYYVVGGDVITEFGDKFKAKVTNVSDLTGSNNYLYYSSAATYGLYYTNKDVALEKYKNNKDKVQFPQ